MPPTTTKKSAAIGAFTIAFALLLIPSQAYASGPPCAYDNTASCVSPSTRLIMIGAGFGFTAGIYAIGLPFSYKYPDAPGAKDLRIPIAGPWMALAHTGCPSHDPDCSQAMVWTRAFFTTMSGMYQAVGLTFVLVSVMTPTWKHDPRVAPSQQRPTRSPGGPDSTPPERPHSDPPQPDLFLIPVPTKIGNNGFGLSVSGLF
ncbi:MAG: hypothetical protein FWD57_01470 [Polyangiaceae bacterium]|nr:hypothetical protein [Polyangiaceae bacterium]